MGIHTKSQTLIFLDSHSMVSTFHSRFRFPFQNNTNHLNCCHSVTDITSYVKHSRFREYPSTIYNTSRTGFVQSDTEEKTSRALSHNDSYNPRTLSRLQIGRSIACFFGCRVIFFSIILMTTNMCDTFFLPFHFRLLLLLGLYIQVYSKSFVLFIA